jgi:2-desacetyl-2-hydroxyethyl bacteriochlorophyllide A dehydrogenase
VAWPIPEEHPVMRTARETRARDLRHQPDAAIAGSERAAATARSTLCSAAVRVVAFQAPGEVRVEERPEPELLAPDDAVVRVEATGICGSDLHIYHGRVAIEPGFVIGHEYVGTVIATGEGVTEVTVGDRVLGTYCTACGRCFHCRRGEYHKCDSGRVFGHGATLGSLPGAQAEQVLVPSANLTLRRVPEGLSDEAALFAGDVAGTGYHAVCGDAARPQPLEPGAAVAVLGLGPVGLCAVQVARASGASLVVAVDSVEDRLRMAESLGAVPVHLTEDDPRGRVKELTDGRGVDLSVEAVGHPDALDLACRLARKAGTVSVTGVYAERAEVHMGVVWIKALNWRTGHANVIGHLDRVLAMMSAGVLDPSPLVTHRMSLDDAPEAYAIYDRREALKIVLRP